MAPINYRIQKINRSFSAWMYNLMRWVHGKDSKERTRKNPPLILYGRMLVQVQLYKVQQQVIRHQELQIGLPEIDRLQQDSMIIKSMLITTFHQEDMLCNI